MSALRAASADESAAPAAMVDLSFAIDGERLPRGYAFGLEAAVLAALPWLAEEELAGIHPVRAPLTDFGYMLSQRARLVLRIPEERTDAACGLSGTSLALGECRLRLGRATQRRIEPFATLGSWLVATSATDEQGFVDDVRWQLDLLGIDANLICGRSEVLADDERRLGGFGLVLHELSAADSLRLQARGLGAGRRLGCGVFVQHKIIEGLGGAGD